MSALAEPGASAATEDSNRLPPWDDTQLEALLRLQQIAPLHYRNRYGDPAPSGRSYGGQLLGQAFMAASASVPGDRPATYMQMMFLQSAAADTAIEMTVTPLQEGRRYASRHVRGSQPGGRNVLDGQVTFAAPTATPEHTRPSTAQERPESVPRPIDTRGTTLERIKAMRIFPLEGRACMDFRLAEPADGLMDPVRPRQRFWMRADLTSDDARLHQAAFAYLCDWWMIGCCYSPYSAKQQRGSDEGVTVVSLNHSMWFHSAGLRADRWLHFDCDSPRAGEGRSLVVARVHDEDGRFVASATQECLLMPNEARPAAA